MYKHTILVPKTLVFKPEFYECHHCHKRVQKHIHCDGARFHVHSWYGVVDKFGKTHGVERCSETNCEDNHGLGKCVQSEVK